jgi:putative chitinase
MLPTANQIEAAVGCTGVVARRFAEPLHEACKVYEINTPRRLAAFYAQTGHESSNYTALVENLNYSEERLREVCLDAAKGSRWRSLLPRVHELARNPKGLANAAYGGRMGNGDEASGDGWKYKGRGIIGNTGKTNYESISELLVAKLGTAPDFVLHPEELETPRWAAMAAAAFWDDHDLNELADRGQFDLITSRVNGGKHGAADRRARHARALRALSS